jgi:hypothetical protein
MRHGRFGTRSKRTLPTAKAAPAGAGDIWTCVGLDADTKLVVSWYVGDRDSEAAMTFHARASLPGVRLTSDGHKPYLEAIEGAFGGDIDYAMLVKVYGAAPEGQRRYSPAICTGAHKYRVEGNPRSQACQHVICGAQQSFDPYG